MKKLRSLYLIAADDGFRLVHTHEPDLAEISLNREEASAGGAPGLEAGGSDTKVDEERQRFCRHVVAALEAEWAKGSYDQIVIAAGPRLLGLLRAALPKALHAHVAAELHKDLLNIPLHDLPSHFKEVSEA